jgi:CBS domain containing-hemolysin-like protein
MDDRYREPDMRQWSVENAEVWLVVALVGLIVAAAVLGAVEAALLRVPRVRVEVDADSGRKRAITLLRVLEDLPRALNTVLLVVLLVQISAAAIAGLLAERLFGSLGVTIASIVLTIVLFIYTEALPKTYAVAHPVSVGYTTAPLLAFLLFVLAPIVAVLMWIANIQAPGTAVASPAAPTEQELLQLAAAAADTGTIDETDRRLIDRVFDLGDRNVDEIYVPRPDIVAVPATTTVRQALDTAISSGHRRIPIYASNLDEIVGIVAIIDLAGAVVDEPDRLALDLAAAPLIVPESKAVVELLGEMQRARIHFVVVVDEFGGTAGIVTIEDVVTRLVGRISGEDEVPVEGFRNISDRIWTIPGSAHLADVERALDVQLPMGDWNTVAGLIIGTIDRLPSVGDSVELDGLTLTVLSVEGHRITRIRAVTPRDSGAE